MPHRRLCVSALAFIALICLLGPEASFAQPMPQAPQGIGPQPVPPAPQPPAFQPANPFRWMMLLVGAVFVLPVLFADQIKRAFIPKQFSSNPILLLPQFFFWIGSFLFGLMIYGFVLVLPLFFGIEVFPVLEKANELGVTPPDILVYEMVDESREHFGYDKITVDVRELDEAPAQEAMRQLFPNPDDRALVMSWGNYLNSDDPKALQRRANPDDGWAARTAWYRLNRVPGAQPLPLPELRQWVEQSIPDEAERTRLLEWAGERRQLKRMPELEWFRWWILIEDWCAPPEVFEGRKAEIISHAGTPRKFGHDVWNAFLSWGEDIADERREADLTFPPSSDRASMVAALDRLLGRDEMYDRVERLRQDVRGDRSLSGFLEFAMALHIYYPNDDVPYCVFGEGWERPQDGEFKLGKEFSGFLIMMVALLAFIAQRGMRMLAVRLFGSILGVRQKPVFREYERFVFSPWWTLTSLTIILGVTWLLARVYLEPFYVLYFQSEESLLLAVVWSTLICGVLIETLENVISVFLIRLGYDPHRIILDNILVAVLGVFVLLYFQNNWYAITSALAIGLTGSIAHKIFGRTREEVELTLVEDEEPEEIIFEDEEPWHRRL